MNKLLQHLLLQLRFELTFFDFGDLEDCPLNEFLYLGPSVLHGLRVKYYDNKLEVVLLNRCCKARACCGRNSSLEAGVAGLQEFVRVLPLVYVSVRAREHSRLAVVLLGFHYLAECLVLHAMVRDQCDVVARAVVHVVVHAVRAHEVCVLKLHVFHIRVHLLIEGRQR